jgi:hypothetical protein
MVESVVDKIDAQLPLRAPLSGREASFSFLVDEHFEEVKGRPLQVTVTLDLEGDMTGLKIELYPAEFSGLSSPLVWINTAPARPVTSTLQRSLMGMHVDAVAPASQGEEQDADWPTASTSAGHGQPMAAVAGPSGIGSQHHLDASTSAIPAAAIAATARIGNAPPEPIVGNLYVLSARCYQKEIEKILRYSVTRTKELASYGCNIETHVRTISALCDERQGEFMGNGIYAYRNLIFNGVWVNAYRRLDSSLKLVDLRLLSGSSSRSDAETRILDSMRSAAAKGAPRRIGHETDRGVTTLRYPLSEGCYTNLKYYKRDFARVGLTSRPMIRSEVEQCEAICGDNVANINFVQLPQPRGTPYYVAWLTHNGETCGVLVEQAGESLTGLKSRAQASFDRVTNQTVANKSIGEWPLQPPSISG